MKDEEWEELRKIFLNVALERAKQMREALLKGNFKLIQIYAHQLRGSAGSYGFSDITEIAGQIEEKCISNSYHEVSEFIQRLYDLIVKFNSNSR